MAQRNSCFFVDNDDLIRDHHLGVVVKDFHEMTQAVKDYLEGEEKLRSRGIALYFEQNLTIERKVDEYEALFNSLDMDKNA